MTISELITFAHSAPSAFFTVRFPTESDRRDGFYQRVWAIDQMLARSAHRIYIRTDGPVHLLQPKIREIDGGCFEVQFSRRNPAHKMLAIKLSKAAKCGYAHSILSIENPLESQLFAAAKCRILDLHGAVPEETNMAGDVDRSKLLVDLEKLAVEKSQFIISVSQALLNHVQAKAKIARALVLPISMGTIMGDSSRLRTPNSVVYAGGFQPWQQMDLMLKFVHDHPEMTFSFFTPDPARVSHEYESAFDQPFIGLADSVSPKELAAKLSQFEFGLIFREDSIVNQVSSPTKMAEYLSHGVIPIVDSTAIGDYPSIGFQYVRLDGDLPVPAEVSQMRETNFGVQRTIAQQAIAGSKELVSFVTSLS